jgi:small ligand-binding sensory domain FIST
VGRPYVITRSEGNLIVKLGGKQAARVLHEALSEMNQADQDLFRRGPFLGLALDPTKSQFERGDFLVRGILGHRAEDNALAVSDSTLRVGMTVQFLVRDASSASEDLSLLMQERAGDAAPGSAGALVFSCNGRGSRMFGKPDHDIGCVQSAFPDPIPAAGFFAMGEIGPVGQQNFLHGFTASIGVIRATQSPEA